MKIIKKALGGLAIFGLAHLVSPSLGYTKDSQMLKDAEFIANHIIKNSDRKLETPYYNLPPQFGGKKLGNAFSYYKEIKGKDNDSNDIIYSLALIDKNTNQQNKWADGVAGKNGTLEINITDLNENFITGISDIHLDGFLEPMNKDHASGIPGTKSYQSNLS